MTNVLLYGATGYTGELIARAAVAQGLKPILSGRNASKLEPEATTLGLAYRAFDVNDVSAATAALHDVTVVLNCAGPFKQTAAGLIQACLRSGSHYLDIAGEVPEFQAVAAHDAAATTANIMLLPGVGFGVVPTDCLALHLKQLLPTATHLTLAFQTIGGASRGTVLTVLQDIHRQGVIRRNGVLVPTRAASQRLKVDPGEGTVSMVLNPWRADLWTAYISTGIANIETYSVFPGPLQVLMRAGGLVGPLLNWTGTQKALHRLVQNQAAGPSAAERAAGKTLIWGEVHDQSGAHRVSRLRGPEAYTFTALTAVAILKRVLAGDAPVGFQTPAKAYGPDLVLEIAGVQRIDAPN